MRVFDQLRKSSNCWPNRSRSLTSQNNEYKTRLKRCKYSEKHKQTITSTAFSKNGHTANTILNGETLFDLVKRFARSTQKNDAMGSSKSASATLLAVTMALCCINKHNILQPEDDFLRFESMIPISTSPKSKDEDLHPKAKSHHTLAARINELISPRIRTKMDASDVVVAEDHGITSTTKLTSYETSVRALQGWRLYMEDEYCIGDGGCFAAVFDGHGGNAISKFLRLRLYERVNYFKRIEMEKEMFKGNEKPSTSITIASYITAIKNAFNAIDEEILNDSKLDDQGSTATAVFLHKGDDGESTIISANVGDSRAVLARRSKAVDLTRDHKPNEEQERSRILKMGEKVVWDRECRVYRVRGLSLSRALGDKFAKPAISGEVEIKSFPLLKDDDFIVLGSDGLWDVLTSQEVVSYVYQTLRSPYKGKIPLSQLSFSEQKRVHRHRRKQMGRQLAKKAYSSGSSDNICVIVVWLKDLQFS